LIIFISDLEELEEDELVFESNQAFDCGIFPHQETTLPTTQEAVVTVAHNQDNLAESLIALGHYYRDRNCIW
jgi:hypothetical protein